MRCVRLEKGQGLWVAGPARVEVVEGCVYATGFEACSGESLVVAGTRGASFAALGGGARLCIVAGSGSGFAVVEGSARLVEEWRRLVEGLEAEGARRIVLLGPMESGKSTLAVWIHNLLGVAVVEADVGQNELGTPACVSYSVASGRALSLSDLELSGCLFVGHVSAERVLDLIVSSVARAAGRVGSRGFVVDTDGFVSGRGVYYKAALAAAVEPDAVIVMGSAPGLAEALRVQGLRVLEAPAPGLVRERSRFDRRSYRRMLWSRLFSSPRSLVVEGKPVAGLCPFTVEAGEVVRYQCPRGTVEVAPRGARGPRTLRPGWERGLLAAVVYEGGQAPALVERLDPASGRAVLRAAWQPGGEPRGVVLGWLRLGEGFEEEHLRPGLHPEAVLERERAGRHRGR